MNPVFSILIPSWNNLEFLKLCVRSIKRNSAYSHQIIVHVNEGSDGTLDWVKEQKLDYTYSQHNIGVCLSMNMMRSKVIADYICFLNDDMYVLPDWDKYLLEEIQLLPDKFFFLSATTIQPSPSTSVIAANYGRNVDEFQEKKLLSEFREIPFDDWMGATLPPNIVHRDIWDMVGGYSVELSPGMYSDPDFTAKLWFCGVRYMKGISRSRVYHFEAKTTARIVKNNGSFQFLLKWGMTSSTFRKLFTYKGRVFDQALVGRSENNMRLRLNLVRGRIKALLLLLYKAFGPLWELEQ